MRAWPTEPLAIAPDAAVSIGAEPAPSPGGESEVEVEVEVGRSSDGGRLVMRRHPRVGRLVLVEERDTPLDEAALARLRALAAAGGPYVQRVLALSEDHRVVTYEAVEGLPEQGGAASVRTIEELPQSDREALAAALVALHAPGTLELTLTPGARVIRTAGGPVILIAPRPAAAPVTSSSR